MSTTNTSTTTTISQFMNLPANLQYRELRFFNSSLTGLDELYVSRYGAIHIHHGSVKNFYPEITLIHLDDFSRNVVLGTDTTYENLDFKYTSFFYV